MSTIDIDVHDTFTDTLDSISAKIPEESIAVGYSMGARVALSAALEHPRSIKGLVLISLHAGLTADEKVQRQIEDESLAQLFLDDATAGFETLDNKNVFGAPAIELSSLRISNSEQLAQQLRILGLGNSPYNEDRLIELRIPVLYVSGTRDEKYTQLAARYKKKTPFSHHRVLDSDHRVPIQAPDTLSLLIDWFDTHVANR